MVHSDIKIARGDASLWYGKADVVITHPYAPIPACLHDKPMFLNLYERTENRQNLAERWIGGRQLVHVAWWGKGLTNHVYAANLPQRDLEMADLVEDYWDNSNEWMPLSMPMRLLLRYADIIKPGMTVWDGFMGRGTIGAACYHRGLNYIGVDNNPDQVERAKRYLGSLMSAH